MVGFNYTSARWKATGIISRFGKIGTFTIKGNDGGYDGDGNVIAAQPDSYINGIITPLLQYKSNEIDGTTIKSGDSYVFFDSNTDIPLGAITTINSDEFRAVDKKSLKSVGGVSVYQKIQLRR